MENFLKDQNLYDLLWKLYLNQGKMVPAAMILIKLAERKDNSPLMSRLEYLARAADCLGQGVAVDRDFSQQLQEKIEVANIQWRIQSELRSIQDQRKNRAEEAAKALDAELFPISDVRFKLVNF